ncbi:hypothetical protein MASR2M117_10340 [Paludibacter sp.]
MSDKREVILYSYKNYSIMQKQYLITVFMFALIASSSFAQKLHSSQVPSIILNSFQQQFTKARDVEWRLEKSVYKVDFEVGTFFPDHTVWYNEEGKMIRHKEEISKRQLPASVLVSLNKDFKGFNASDIKQITEGKTIIYTMDMKNDSKEWNIKIDSSGKILSRASD